MDTENVTVTLSTLRDNAILFIPTLITGLVLFIIFWLVSKFARRIIRRIGKETELPAEVCSLVADVVGVTILGFGIITALGTIGIDIGAMIAGLGLTGFALAFALQDIISSTLAGIMLLMYRPFAVGQRIKVGGNEGVVTDSNLRYTRLNNEGNAILLPNSTLFKEAIIVFDDVDNPHPLKLTTEVKPGDAAPAPTVPGSPKIDPNAIAEPKPAGAQ
jgi:small conductance mechanosensitive channel